MIEDEKGDGPTWVREDKLNRKTGRNIHSCIEFDV